MFLLAAPLILAKSDADMTVVDVRETKVFAGKLGHRIFTDVTVKTADGRTMTIHIDGIKHDLFRPHHPAFQAGDHAKMVAGHLVKA